MRKNIAVCFVVVVLLGVSNLCIPQTVCADSVELGAVRDNTLYEEGNLSNGSGDFFFAGRNGGGSERRALLLFDLGAIPDGATIESVALELTVSQANSVVADVGLHRLLSDWGESTSDANGGEGGGIEAEVGDATWLHSFYPGTLWSNPGGDFDATASATQSVIEPDVYTWQSSGLVADVQSWVDGSVDNFGWALVNDSLVSGSAKRFNSRDNAASPILRVEFSVVPEPSCVALLSVLGCAVVVRRRKAC